MTAVNCFGTSEIKRHGDQVQEFRKDTAIGSRISGKALQLGPGIQERHCKEQEEVNTCLNGKVGLLSGLQIQQQVTCKTNQDLMVHLHVQFV